MEISSPQPKSIILVSDGTGETASQMMRAVMVQFHEPNVVLTRYKNMRTEAQIDAIVEEASRQKALIIFTLVSAQLRMFLWNTCRQKNVASIDLLGPVLHSLAEFLGFPPKSQAGLLHRMDENYFRRIEAMEYTIAHDDGKDLSAFDKADLIILGISRTSKTPLSMYLSHQGWRVVNIPLVKDFPIPKEIFEIDQRKVIGLTIDGSELAKIRRARLERLGQDKGGDYASLDKVLDEIEFAQDLYKRNRKWAIFNVTGKALEETAWEIIRLMESRKLAPKIAGSVRDAVIPGSGEK